VPDKMPSLIGMTVDKAKATMTSLGWQGAFFEKPEEVFTQEEDGIVRNQSPPAGAAMPENQTKIVLGVGEYVPPTTTIGWRMQPLAIEIELGEISVGAPEPEPGSGIPWLLIAGIAAALLAGLAAWRWFSTRPRDAWDEPEEVAGSLGIRQIRIRVEAPQDQPLVPGRRYRLAVHIGELPGAGPAAPVPLDVVVFGGAGTPTQQVALTGAQVPLLTFGFTASAGLRLRCGLYVRGVLQQAFIVETGPGGWRAARDYGTSFSLDPAALANTGPHELSLMVNHDSSHDRGIYAYFAGSRTAMAGQISMDHIDFHQRCARELYTAVNAARHTRSQLAGVLGSLALCGAGVFRTLRLCLDEQLYQSGQDPDALWARLRYSVRVQVVWPLGDSQPLPAAVVYDYPLKEIPSAQFALCPAFFEDLDRGVAPRCSNGGCVSQSNVVVCPAGFWGFRLLLGSPLSRGEPAPDQPVNHPVPPVLVIGKSYDPGFRLRDRHLAALSSRFSQAVWYEEGGGEALVDVWRTVQPNLIYLYCHGDVDRQQGIGWVEVGNGEQLSARGLPGDFFRRWRSAPLVFLNGCSTAALAADIPNSLTRWFLWAGAGGVLGTEIVVHEPIACMFAEAVLPAMLLGARPIGEAVLAARTDLLRWGSALGLSYVALAPADLRLVRG
jgi:PASTA domain/CHAT domain